MKDQYEFHRDGVRPIKATSTQWIDHKLCAVERLVDIFDAKVLLRYGFLVTFSLLLKYLALPLTDLILILLLLLRTLN